MNTLTKKFTRLLLRPACSVACLLTCLLAPAWLGAEPLVMQATISQPMTLQQAVDLALEHAPAIHAAEAGRDAASEDAAIGRAGLLPYVEMRGSLQRRNQNTAFDAVPAIPLKTDLNYNANRIGIRIVQPLIDLQRWAGYRQGELSAEAGALKLELEQQRLMLETARALLGVATAQASLEAAQAREDAAAKLATQAGAAYRVGTAARTDLLDAEARHDQAKAERLAARNDLDQARALLTSLTGMPVDMVAAPKISNDPGLPLPAGVSHWEQLASEKAIAVKLAAVQFDVAKQEEKRALGGALPKVEAFAEVSRDRAGDSMFGTGTTLRDRSVGIQFRMPLYAGGGTRAQMRKSKNQSVQAEFALEDDMRLARLTARQAYLSLQSAAAQVRATGKARASAEQAAKAAHLGHKVGLRSVSEVLDADERKFAADRNLAVARAQYVFATLQLRASIGELAGEPLPTFLGEEP